MESALRVVARAGAVAALLAAALAPARATAVQAPHTLVVSEDPADFTPHVLDGRVNAIASVGGTMVAGGSFDEVQEPGGPILTRHKLFAFDAGTGAVSAAFAPTANGRVFALASDGTYVYAAGEFSRVRRVNVGRIVKLDLDGNVVTSFQANVTAGSAIHDLAIANGLLYMGGAFTEVNGQARSGLAAVDLATGELAAGVNVPFEGLHNGGTSRVAKLDVTPDGSVLVAIGNFTAAGGQPRHQVATLDLDGTNAVLSSWSTDRFVPQCTAKFDTYTRDVDISPDGSYFVIVTTGAFQGGANLGKLCDSASRWEIGPTGSGQQPSWIDYAGGDTSYSVAVTGTAVYVGGHFRWWNNAFVGDNVGPGTVKRRGVAALDPLNGLPLSWNPGRELGEGVFSLVGTPEGLWVGSDSDEIGGEYHAKLAFFPLAGGSAVPEHVPATLPGELYSLPAHGCASVDPSILYRVNAAGEALPSLDCGPGWAADTTASPSPYRNSGSSAASWTYVPSLDASVPASGHPGVFASERWDSSSPPEMQWDFPVASGTPVRVRLYFADRCTCTTSPGQRKFDVTIEGSTVLNDYDIVADAGWGVGTTKGFDVVSDGTITISFGHVVQNPLVNAIELIDLAATPVVPSPSEYLNHRGFDGVTPSGLLALTTTAVDWSRARGAFVTGGRIYYGWSDGKVYSRSFNGTKVGKASQIYLRGLTPHHFPTAGVTGMFFENGRLYYTVAGQDKLFMRYFTPESGVIGAVTFTVAGPGDGLDWLTVRGMTLANGKVYVARPGDVLESIDWSAGAPVTGTRTVVDSDAGQAWASRGMFVWN
jgi:hypothetical protein